MVSTDVNNVEVEYKKGVTRAGVDVDVLEEHQIGDHKFNGDWIVMDILRKLNPGMEAKSGSTR
ncbi:hypothetical protein HN51_011163 [Arachis hypogaea]